MKTKKQNNQSQPFELIFPEMYQTHPWPFLQVQPDPFVILSAAEALWGRLFIYMELKPCSPYWGPMVSHDFCIFIFIFFTLFLRDRTRGWRPLVPKQPAGLFISYFLDAHNILEILPRHYFCYKTFLTLQARLPRPHTKPLSPSWWPGCWTFHSDDWLPWASLFILWSDDFMSPVCELQLLC